MQLWQVIQWGNIVEGGNGPDTQCIISAVDMQAAIKEGEFRIEHHNLYIESMPSKRPAIRDWPNRADVAYLLGQDHRSDGDPIVIVPVWVAHAFNMAHSPSWHRHHHDSVWMTQKEMYGE
jgi:hypothetical protein